MAFGAGARCRFCTDEISRACNDFDKTTIANLNKNKLPIYEPQLDTIINQYHKSGRIIFSTSEESVKKTDVVIIAYDTPLSEKDEADISPIIAATKKIAANLSEDSLVVIVSQVPLGTTEKLGLTIKKINSRWNSNIAYVPENLQLGTAISRFHNPDMIVIGADTKQAREKTIQLYKSFNAEKVLVSLHEAEMVKHALNGFLGLSIAYGNEIAHICEKFGVDAFSVLKTLKLDKRVGKAPILPGLGYSGGTIARDIRQLLTLSKKVQYAAPVIKSIDMVNKQSFEQIVYKINSVYPSLKGRTIGILGITYKPGTSTLRRSPALTIANVLTKKGAVCLYFDLHVAADEIKDIRYIKRQDDVFEMAEQSDILLLITEWPEFRQIQFDKLAKIMRRPVIVDAKNFLVKEDIEKAGFEYIGYGR